MFGIKDSEFKETDSVKHDDKVAIVQEGDNRIVGLEELAEYIIKDVREEFKALEKRLKAVEDAIAGGTVAPPVEPDEPVKPDEMVTLWVSAYPENAVIYLNNAALSGITVKKGSEVTILVKCDGYKSYTDKRVVNKSETIVVRLEAIEKPTETKRDLVLDFDGDYESVPASGGNWEMRASLEVYYSDGTKTVDDVTDSVEVAIDNDALKYNGGAFYWLENTTYENRVAKVDVAYGYLTRQCTFVQLAAQRIQYTVTINPTPSNAVVKINGVVRNSIVVNAGETVSYEVLCEGYDAKTGTIVADDNKTIDVVLVEQKPIEPATVTFSIAATPADAVVTINGEQRKEITVDKGETIEWSVSMDGYIQKNGTHVCDSDYELSVSLEKIEVTETLFEVKSIKGEYGSVSATGGSFFVTAKLTTKYNYGDDVVSDVSLDDCEVSINGDLVYKGSGEFVWGANASDMRSAHVNITYQGESLTFASSQLGVSDYVIINNGKDLSFTSANESKDIEIRANVDWEITIKQ